MKRNASRQNEAPLLDAVADLLMTTSLNAMLYSVMDGRRRNMVSHGGHQRVPGGGLAA